MSGLEIDRLVDDVSADAPCGENLEYDPAFGEMERASQAKPETQVGDTISPAEEPDWREVRKRALELFDRTRDLRVAVPLAQAMIHTDGVGGFAGGLAVVRGLLERHWDAIHPRLDPDDDNDPTWRMNIIASLADAPSTLR